MSPDRTIEIRRRIEEIRQSLQAREIEQACARLTSCKQHVRELRECLQEIEAQIEEVPAIEIAFLGPSRHGKSTLMNELTAVPLLSTSDTKPCTAAIVRMKWAADWSLSVKFIDKELLRREWQRAVADAEDYLDRQAANSSEEAPDDRGYLKSTLQRFIHLFQLDASEEPRELVRQIKEAKIPKEVAQHLGQERHPNANSVKHFQGIIREYLSTEGIYWTIVESCDICGPFDSWHPKLSLADLPGTNDTDPHRSAITNSLRSAAKAIAILTSDSNLGLDIESWLQNSTVVGNFLEAQETRRQRLFIIRTKLDSHLPAIDPDELDKDDPESEDKLRRGAVERYKLEQTDAYHGMLKDIVLPLLPVSCDGTSVKQKRQELLEKVTNIPVFFVSSQAHAAFKGQLKATTREIRNLKEDFYNDLSATGVPELKEYLNAIAQEYLAKNHYEDIEARLESEVGRLVQYFQKETSAVQAQMAGAGESVRQLVTYVHNDVVPWVKNDLLERVQDFSERASAGNRDIKQRLDQVWAMSQRRFQDKTEKWNNYAWNTLRATARKGGTHTRSDGSYIDVNQDICSVLVDDLILVWTSYRDYLINERVHDLTDDFVRQLQVKLQQASRETDIPEAREAMSQILSHLGQLTISQRDRLLRVIEKKITQLESLRKPAYDFIARTMEPTFHKIERERGTGCQQRMRNVLLHGFHANIDSMRDYLQKLINDNVDDLLESCRSALTEFGHSAAYQIEESVSSIAETQRMKDQQLLGERRSLLVGAVAALPPPRR